MLRRIPILPTTARTLRQSWYWLRAKRRADLDALARYYGTDKYQHRFTPIYRRHFASRRRTIQTILEIGVGGTTSATGLDTAAGGASLLMWRDYFPNAKVIGVDVHPKAITGERIYFELGDQADQEFLHELVARHGPFNIVIDDGSHMAVHVRASFNGLWDAVAPGGFYVIEDLAAAYEPMYGGGPPGTPGTVAELLKAQVDRTIRHPGQPVAIPHPDRPVAAIYLYADLVILEKSG